MEKDCLEDIKNDENKIEAYHCMERNYLEDIKEIERRGYDGANRTIGADAT